MTETNNPYGIDAEDIEKNKAMGGIAYLWILFFVPLVACPESKYGRFHANQGLLLLITGFALMIVGWILSAIFGFLGVFGAILVTLIWLAIWAANLALTIIGLINGFSGKVKELPIIGKFRLIK